MKKVSILEFRRDARGVIRKVRQGKSLILTYRGQPVMRLEPIQGNVIDQDDPLYTISKLAEHDRQLPVEQTLTISGQETERDRLQGLKRFDYERGHGPFRRMTSISWSRFRRDLRSSFCVVQKTISRTFG